MPARLLISAAACLLMGLGGATAAEPLRIGEKVDNVVLRDLKDQAVRLHDLGRGARVTVVMFISTECPVSNDYNERMAALDRDYSPRGVRFVAVNSNRQETPAQIADHAARNGFGFAVYKDAGNDVADRLDASVTPEMYVFDGAWTLRYHGRVDDSSAAARVSAHDLRGALDALLAGREAPVRETRAFGCSIKRVRKR